MEKIKFKAHTSEVSNTRRKIINSKGLAVKAWIDVLMVQCKEEALDKLFELACDSVYDLSDICGSAQTDQSSTEKEVE
jgi:hypothetical protein